MASRVFVDRAGTEWTVWDVVPGDGHATSLQVSTLPRELSGGWLCFENAAVGKRRLYPIPPDWTELPEDKLHLLCHAAVVVQRRAEPVLGPLPVPAG